MRLGVRVDGSAGRSLIVLLGCAFVLGWILGSACQYEAGTARLAATPEAETTEPTHVYDWRQMIAPRRPGLHPVIVALGEVLVCLVAVVAAARPRELERHFRWGR